MQQRHIEHETLGAWLGGKIAEHGITQTELARRVGVSQTQISSYLRGKRRPSPETCAKLAEALAVPVDQVLIVAGHRPPVAADGDMELKEMVEILRQIPLDQRPPIKDYLQWQLDRAQLSGDDDGHLPAHHSGDAPSRVDAARCISSMRTN